MAAVSRTDVYQTRLGAAANPSEPEAPAPDPARLAELYDRFVPLDRCAGSISRTPGGAMRLSTMRQRLLLSMRASGLPESRWFPVGRRGLYLEPDPGAARAAPSYRLRAASWSAVRLWLAVRRLAPVLVAASSLELRSP